MIRHYYHVYADGDWMTAVNEHFLALDAIGATVQMTVGIVGDAWNRQAVTDRIELLCVRWGVELVGISWATKGHEQLTLDRLWAEAVDHDAPILYAHTKGAANGEQVNVDWRHCMTKHTVRQGNVALALLADGADVVGSHWFDPRQQVAWQKPYFAGNFWWATAAYIRSLPPLEDRPEGGSCSCGCKPGRCRYTAELWIGLNDPDYYDLMPGAPGQCKEHI